MPSFIFSLNFLTFSFFVFVFVFSVLSSSCIFCLLTLRKYRFPASTFLIRTKKKKKKIAAKVVGQQFVQFIASLLHSPFQPIAMSSKKKADKKAKNRSSLSNASAINMAKVAPADRGDMAPESQPDHSMSSPSTLQNASQSSITIQMDDPASSPRLNAASLPGYRSSPDIMQGSPAHVDHQHPEPSIGERFGRRHGQDWPARIGPSGNKCSSCPGSRSESRSISRGGMRRTSGVLYKAIPVRPVIGAHVFQSARKSEQAMGAIKGMPQVQEFYRTQVSDESIRCIYGSLYD